MKETKQFDTLQDGIDHAKLHGGRIATLHNAHEVVWFAHEYTPSDILLMALGMGIDTFGTWGSFPTE